MSDHRYFCQMQHILEIDDWCLKMGPSHVPVNAEHRQEDVFTQMLDIIVK